MTSLTSGFPSRMPSRPSGTSTSIVASGCARRRDRNSGVANRTLPTPVPDMTRILSKALCIFLLSAHPVSDIYHGCVIARDLTTPRLKISLSLRQVNVFKKLSEKTPKSRIWTVIFAAAVSSDFWKTVTWTKCFAAFLRRNAGGETAPCQAPDQIRSRRRCLLQVYLLYSGTWKSNQSWMFHVEISYGCGTLT